MTSPPPMPKNARPVCSSELHDRREKALARRTTALLLGLVGSLQAMPIGEMILVKASAVESQSVLTGPILTHPRRQARKLRRRDKAILATILLSSLNFLLKHGLYSQCLIVAQSTSSTTLPIHPHHPYSTSANILDRVTTSARSLTIGSSRISSKGIFTLIIIA